MDIQAVTTTQLGLKRGEKHVYRHLKRYPVKQSHNKPEHELGRLRTTTPMQHQKKCTRRARGYFDPASSKFKQATEASKAKSTKTAVQLNRRYGPNKQTNWTQAYKQ